MSLEFEQQPWAEHMESMRPRSDGSGWQQGDHMLIAAPTKSGKTELQGHLASIRTDVGGHVVMFITKTKDDTLKEPVFKLWDRHYDWPPGRYDDLVFLHPKMQPTPEENLALHRQVFSRALDDIFIKGRRTVMLDELHYMSDPQYAGLASKIAIMHHQGRSGGITMVNSTQRPAWVPKIIYSSVSHVYIARTRDEADLKRLSDMGGIDGKAVANAVRNLPSRHHFLYLNPLGDREPVIVNTRE